MMRYCFLISMLMLFALLLTNTHGQKTQSSVEVRVGDINAGRVRLIGRLGEPLGQMLTVAGTWKESDRKSGDLEFVADRVNGTLLREPVIFKEPRVKVVKAVSYKLGTRWTLRAYETGEFTVTPEAYWKESGLGTQQAPTWFRDKFATRLEGIVQ